MSHADFKRQAERCRQQAVDYAGQPESLVLLRIAREFDRLARGAPAHDASIPQPAIERNG